jgi:hypothetical protein
LIDFVGVIVELYSFDTYGNAIGFDSSVALTEFLYSGEQFDSKIGQQFYVQDIMTLQQEGSIGLIHSLEI